MKEVLCGNIKFYISVIKGMVIIKYGGNSYMGRQYKVILKINKDNKIINKEFIYIFSITNSYFEMAIENIKNKNQVEMKIEEVDEYSKYVGLVNLSNTCYANAFIQSLYFLPEFKKYIFNSSGYYALLLKRLFWRLDKINENKEKEYKNKSKLEDNYSKIIENNKNKASDIISESISRLINNLTFIKSVFEQHDTHEFSKMLFERLEIEDEKIKEIIEGKLLTIIKCSCGCKIKRIEPFQDITLPLETNGKQFRNIHASLEIFCNEEELNGYCCEKHGRVEAIKSTEFLKLPDIIFMLIPRFKIDWERGKYMKDNDLYEFPEEIDFNKYCTNCDNENINLKNSNTKLNNSLTDNNNIEKTYKLYSVIVHSGVFEEGHFYTYLNLDNKYYKFNDEEVNEASREEAVDWNYGGKYRENRGLKKRFSAYYLIYRRNILKNQNNDNEMVDQSEIIKDNEKINLDNISKDISCIIENITFFYTHDFQLIGSWGPYGYNCDTGLFNLITPKETKKCLLFDNVSKIFGDMLVYKIENNFNAVKHEAIQNNGRYLLTKPEKGILIFVKILNNISEFNFPLLPTVSVKHFNSFTDLINVNSEFMNLCSEKICFFIICGIFLYEIHDFKDIQIGDTIIIANYDKINQIIFAFIFNLLKCIFKPFVENTENYFCLLNTEYVFSTEELNLIIQNYFISNPVIFENNLDKTIHYISKNNNLSSINKISAESGFITIFSLSNYNFNIPFSKQYEIYKNNIFSRKYNYCQDQDTIYHTHLTIIPHKMSVNSFISHLKSLPFSCCQTFSNKDGDFNIIISNDNTDDIRLLQKNDIIEPTSSTLFIIPADNNTKF